MDVGRRFWEAAGVAIVLAGLAPIVGHPAPLFGAAGIGAVLLARHRRFSRRSAAALDGLTVSVTPLRDRGRVDEPVDLLVEVDSPADLPITLTLALPVGGRAAGSRALTLDADTDAATTTIAVEFPFAGRYDFDPPTVTVTEPTGLFSKTARKGSTPSVRIEPRGPSDVYLGRGGEQFTATYGDHGSAAVGAGIVPAEVRQYVPGDAIARIDWRATARLNELYVREFEAETDRTMALVVDARPRMATGEEGESQFDFARHVAAALLGIAADHGDPIGLFTVRDDRLERDAPASTAAHYRALGERLQALHAAADEPGTTARQAIRPAIARRRGHRLGDDDSELSRRLGPFFGDAGPFIHELRGDPLVQVAGGHIQQLEGTVWTAIVTDDSDPGAAYETVKLARQANNHVLAFLTPDVLFEPGGLSDLDAAYDRYREFVEFRQDLDRLERVTALELGPQDRLEAVLAHRRRSPTAPAGTEG